MSGFEHSWNAANGGVVLTPLRLVHYANALFDPLRQHFVFRSDFLHCEAGIRIEHRVSLGQQFLGTCSPAGNEQMNLRVWDNLTSWRH
jgi:hypothetical protein